MGNRPAIQVYSEIGRLQKVLLHRPGKEIENLTPDLMDRLLFDDIPYLEVARQEHDAFANIFKANGVEVVYLEQLAAEAIADEGVRRAFIKEYVAESKIAGTNLSDRVEAYFRDFTDYRTLVDKMMEGIRKEEISDYAKTTLADMVASSYPFIVDPMPNLYFTRDPFATIGTGISLNHMRTVTRNRETLFVWQTFALSVNVYV